MFKGLMFFVKFSWRHDKKYLIYRIESSRYLETKELPDGKNGIEFRNASFSYPGQTGCALRGISAH